MLKLLELRVIAIFGILGGTMLWIGFQQSNSEKVPTLYNYVHEIKTNGAKWVKIKNCTLNVMKSSFTANYSEGGAKEIFVPIETSSNKLNTSYYLQTKDTAFVHLFNKLHKIHVSINAARTKIELGKTNPDFLKSQQTSAEKQIAHLTSLQKKYNNLKTNYPLIKTSISGFISVNDIGMSLGTTSEDIIIKHNETPASSFYVWVLFICGVFFILIFLFGLIGFLTQKNSNKI